MTSLLLVPYHHFKAGGTIFNPQVHTLAITPMPVKTWLITKEQHLPQARELFQEARVNITSQGHPYLGATLGSEDFCDQFVGGKVRNWQEELTLLAKVAKVQLHATYAAFIHGFTHTFTYFYKTTPCKGHLLQPLEDVIRYCLIPAYR